LSKKR